MSAPPQSPGSVIKVKPGIEARARRSNRTIGERIRGRRRTRGLSQTAVGKALGVSYQQIQKYESGKDRLAVSTLLELSDILGVPISYFLNDLRN